MSIWKIPADEPAGELTIELRPAGVVLTQDAQEMKVTRNQLGEFADKLYFLDQTFQQDAEQIVEALCAPPQRA